MTVRISRFAELDKLIAANPEVRKPQKQQLAPTPVREYPKALYRVRDYFRRHVCFICSSRALCYHRESGIAIAIMERANARYEAAQMPQRHALADRSAIVEANTEESVEG